MTPRRREPRPRVRDYHFTLWGPVEVDDRFGDQAAFLSCPRRRKRDETPPKTPKPERLEDVPAKPSAVSRLPESVEKEAQEGQRGRGAVPKVAAPRKARKRSRRNKVSREVPASGNVKPEVRKPMERSHFCRSV